MSIVAMRPWHLMSVMLNLRQADREDFAANGVDDLEMWACQRSLATGAHLAALDENGIPVACFGLLDDKGVGIAWVVATDQGPRYTKSMFKAFKKLIDSKMFRQVEAVCRTERPALLDYFCWLGFKYCGELPRHFVNGNSASLFSMGVQ